MNPTLIDSHSHIQFPAYEIDQDAVLGRMRDKGIWTICVGTSAMTSQAGIAFAEAHEGVFAAVGHHPEHLTSSFHDDAEGDTSAFDIKELELLAMMSPKVVGIGETGLDFFRIDEPRDREASKLLQEFAFRQHIDLARRLEKPVIIHCREAMKRLAEIIADEQEKGHFEGVVHCFTGSWEDAKPLLDLGLHISFTGIITFPEKKGSDPELSMRRVVERMPIERLLIETDAPWLAPDPYRGKRNEPVFVEEVARTIAELRGMSFEEVASVTTQNARALFKI